VEAKITLDETITIGVQIGQQCSMLFVPSVDPLAKFLLNPMVEKRYFAVSVLKIMVVVRERLVLGILDGHRCMTNVAPDLALQIDRCSEPPAISVVKVARSPFGRLMVNQSFVATVLPRPKPIPEGRLVLAIILTPNRHRWLRRIA